MSAADGRATILARLAALPAAGQPVMPRAPGPAAPTAHGDAASLSQRFVQALERVHATWEMVESPVVARMMLATRLQEQGVKRVLSWTASQLPVAGALEALEVLGIEVITPALPLADARLRPQDLDVRRRYLLGIESVAVGLTGADAAFAATGTLLLQHGPGRPLLVSELPRRHIVLLAASRIVPSLESWLATRARPTGQPALTSPISTLLTGPSRSSDIEATPAFGVHGPGKLHVMVIREERG